METSAAFRATGAAMFLGYTIGETKIYVIGDSLVLECYASLLVCVVKYTVRGYQISVIYWTLLYVKWTIG